MESLQQYLVDPSDPIIKLLVTTRNGDEKVFNIHSGVLSKSSAYFQRAMKSEWITKRDGSDAIELKDDSSDTVKDYVQWLYNDKIAFDLYQAEHHPEATREEKCEGAEKVFVRFAHAYVFGEKRLDTKYKNAVLKAVVANIESASWNMGPDSVNIVYEGTSSGSPFRKLIADRFGCWACDDVDEGVGWMTFLEGYPREALIDVTRALVSFRPQPEDRNVQDADCYLEKED